MPKTGSSGRPIRHRKPGEHSSDTVDPSLGYQIRYLYRAFVKALAVELGPYAITTSQWSALRVLWQADGISQVALAQRMLVEKASLTSVLDAMEAGGLISRTRDANDRRKVNIRVTQAGRGLKNKLLPIGAKINKRATQALSAADVKELRRLLARVKTNIEF